MKFKVGDRVKYDSGNPESVDTGIITEADPAHWFYETRAVEAYYIHWDKYPDHNGWIAIGNLTLLPNEVEQDEQKQQEQELITDYAVVLTKEEVQQLINEVAAVSPSAGLHLAKFFLAKVL